MNIGKVLSKATTSSARCLLYEEAEDKVEEGLLVLVNTTNGKILSRIEAITPYHEYYEEGPWSEPIRHKYRIPEEVARKYVVAELSLLGKLTPYGLTEVSTPPTPGSEVLLLSEREEGYKEIFGVDKESPGYVWAGTILGYENFPIPLDIENITMHIANIGVTGSGKSYTGGYLLELLSRIPYKTGYSEGEIALPTIIVDANEDYLDYAISFHRGEWNTAYKDVITFISKNSPLQFKYPDIKIKEISIDLDVFTPRELAELVIIYYSGGVLNELQVSGLESVLKELVEEEAFKLSEIFIEYIDELLSKLRQRSSGRDAIIHSQTAKAIERAIHKFRDDVIKEQKIISLEPTISGKLIDEITENPSLLIFDFSSDGCPKMPLGVKQLIVAYLAKLLFNKFTEYKISGTERYLLFMMEEAQNWCPNLSVYPIGYSLAREYISLIATQGRKFGLILCLITQRPSFVDPIVLSMIGTFIIHRISPEDISFVKKVTGGLPKVLERKLTNLRRGTAIVIGQMNTLGFPILVKIKGRKIPHRMGKTEVMKGLVKIVLKGYVK